MSVKIRERGRSWWVFVDHHGQRKAKRIGEGKAAKKLAEQVRDQWTAWLTLGDVAKVFAPKATAPTPTSTLPRLRDAVVAWIDRREASGDFRGATGPAYRAAVRTWIVDHTLPDGRKLGDLPADQVSREQLGEIILKMKAAKRSRSTVEHMRNVLRGFFRELVETKYVQVNPASDLGFFVGRLRRGRRVGIFDKEECRTLLRATEGTRWHAFVACALGAGLRWGELAALTRDDVDLAQGRLHVRRSWSPKAAAVQAPKNGKGRFVPMAPELVEVMRAQVERRTAEGWGKEALVFPAEGGGHLRHFHERWAALLGRAQVAYRPFHCCRHSFASHALRAGVRPELVQRWMGHSSLTMTLGTYAEFIPDAEGDALDAAKLGSILRDA
jgi:integrase